MHKVVVIGGGVVGMSAAYRLLRHGVRVVVVDRADEGKATAAGAGILSPGNRFPPNDSILPFLKQAHAYYPELIANLAEDGEYHTGYEKVGAVHVAITDEEAVQIPKLLEQVQQRRLDGFHHIGDAKIIDADAAKSFFPALSPVKAAIHIPEAARVDSRLLCSSLKRAVRRRGADLFHDHTNLVVNEGKVTNVTVGSQTISADAVIVAAGAWSSKLAKQIGITVSVYPQRGQIAHLVVPHTKTAGWSIVISLTHYILTFPPNRVVVGATREDVGYDYRVTIGGMQEIIHEGLRMAVGLESATFQEIRIGFRPQSLDAKPLIGQVPGIQNVYFATGHGGYGLQVGLFSGAIIADLVLYKWVSIDLNPFAVGRFDRDYNQTSK
ncbi:NAD(P)/FAD-dependent oxidoreductase [Chlorogloeopsis sp. ULAP02]|uniref:NAD(P)/FAD-dependent oxidoreductase n=1 Tax=Chlorogloeopsis sp. ULAP02 TaxID=3107926 RepID=UPI0031360B5A